MIKALRSIICLSIILLIFQSTAYSFQNGFQSYFDYVSRKLPNNKGPLAQLYWTLNPDSQQFKIIQSIHDCDINSKDQMTQSFNRFIQDIDQNLYLYNSKEMQQLELLRLKTIKEFMSLIDQSSVENTVFCYYYQNSTSFNQESAIFIQTDTVGFYAMILLQY